MTGAILRAAGHAGTAPEKRRAVFNLLVSCCAPAVSLSLACASILLAHELENRMEEGKERRSYYAEIPCASPPVLQRT